MIKKYLLCPGTVFSENDDDIHYISPLKLQKLYNVPMEECVIDNKTLPPKLRNGLIRLEPDYTGEYKIPEEK